VTAALTGAAATLADLAHTLESGEQVEERVRHAVERIRQLVDSDSCVVVNTASDLAPSLVVAPDRPPGEVERLDRDARSLMELMLGRDPGAAARVSVRRSGERSHLAVPLIALGEVVGIVLAERHRGDYGEQELQLLTVAASQLGAYLAALKARAAARSELELRGALAAMKGEDERKSRFLNVLSHELRNPLATLRNAIGILGRVEPTGEQAMHVRAIVGRQIDHLARLVDDLLDMTRISTGKVHLRRARLDAAEVVRRTIEDHGALFSQRGIDLTLDAAASPLWVDGDETRVVQVVGNLLANAEKFTSAGGHVTVSVERESPATAVIRVRDDGEGMEPETLEHLFEPFAQGPGAPRARRGGLGLGLALARGLVELHGGAIEAHSPGLGLGAEFVVRLPLAAEEATDAPPLASAHPPGE
jgi:signal transduction histidine kinase